MYAALLSASLGSLGSVSHGCTQAATAGWACFRFAVCTAVHSMRRERPRSTHGPSSPVDGGSNPSTSAKRGIVVHVAAMGAGHVATSSGADDIAGAVVSLAATRFHAVWLSTMGPTPVASSSDRSTPVAFVISSPRLQQVAGSTVGVNAAGAAHARITT